MSWIIRDLWETLKTQSANYEDLIERDPIQAYEVISRIASEVGKRHGVLLDISFPGAELSELNRIGHRNVTLMVDANRRQFQRVSESQVKQTLSALKPSKIVPVGFGHEGFKADISSGRIDCLASGVHLWCEITPEVLQLLDWLFTNAY